MKRENIKHNFVSGLTKEHQQVVFVETMFVELATHYIRRSCLQGVSWSGGIVCKCEWIQLQIHYVKI